MPHLRHANEQQSKTQNHEKAKSTCSLQCSCVPDELMCVFAIPNLYGRHNGVPARVGG